MYQIIRLSGVSAVGVKMCDTLSSIQCIVVTFKRNSVRSQRTKMTPAMCS